MRRLLFFLLLAASPMAATFAQSARPVQHAISLALLGEKILHPGMRLGYQSSWGKKGPHRWEMGATFGTYLHLRNHIGTRLTPTLGYRYMSPSGWHAGLTADLGVFHRLYQGRVYAVDDAGQVTQKRLRGQSAFTYGGYVSVGKDYLKGSPWGICADLGFFREAQTTGGHTLTHPSLAIGIKRYLIRE